MKIASNTLEAEFLYVPESPNNIAPDKNSQKAVAVQKTFLNMMSYGYFVKKQNYNALKGNDY